MAPGSGTGDHSPCEARLGPCHLRAGARRCARCQRPEAARPSRAVPPRAGILRFAAASPAFRSRRPRSCGISLRMPAGRPVTRTAPTRLHRTVPSEVQMRLLSVALTVFAAAFGATPGSRLAAQERPLSFMDVQELRRAGSWAPSPDGAWMLYTVTTPDWETAESQTDIHLVSLSEGVASERRLTFTDEKDETGSGLGAGRVVLRVLVRPGGERRRRGRERRPALHDAPRRRRGAKDHRRRGWRLRLRVRPRRPLARLPLRRGRPGAALPAGGWRPGRGRCGADHRRARRGSGSGTSPPTGAGSTSRVPTRSTRTRRSGARGGSRPMCGTPSRRSRASGAWRSRRAKSAARRTTRPTVSTASRCRMTAAGSGSRAAPPSATSATSRRRDSMPTSTSRRWRPAGSSVSPTTAR